MQASKKRLNSKLASTKSRHLLRWNWMTFSSTRIRLLWSSLTTEATRLGSKSLPANTTKVCTLTQSSLLDLLLNEEGLEFREEVVYPDGAVYKGQLKVSTDIRHGFGIQVWPDGAKYEGNWRNNVASGRGKFYHIDGDVYDGNPTHFNTLDRKLGER